MDFAHLTDFAAHIATLVLDFLWMAFAYIIAMIAALILAAIMSGTQISQYFHNRTPYEKIYNGYQIKDTKAKISMVFEGALVVDAFLQVVEPKSEPRKILIDTYQSRLQPYFRGQVYRSSDNEALIDFGYQAFAISPRAGEISHANMKSKHDLTYEGVFTNNPVVGEKFGEWRFWPASEALEYDLYCLYRQKFDPSSRATECRHASNSSRTFREQ